jgi:ATP-dependent DNA helicase RecG
MDLTTPVMGLPGIGPAYTQALHKLGIETVGDWLYYPPFRFEDVSAKSQIDSLEDGAVVTISGMITGITNIRTRTGKTIQKASFSDGTGTIDVTWFNQPYLVNTLTKQPHVHLSGKTTRFRGRLSLTSPQYEIAHLTNIDVPNMPGPIHTGRLVPIYHLTQGLTGKWFRARIATLLSHTDIADPLAPIATAHHHLPLKQAINQLHFPDTPDAFYQARNRLAFDELFYLHTASLWRKQRWATLQAKHQFTISDRDIDHFIASLSFTLTGAQLRSLNEIAGDLNANKPMNRLLQGDVGSGKTVIAAAAMYLTARAGYSTLIMAPTEILALQHAKSLQSLLSPFELTVSVQTASRKDSLTDSSIIVGTHALLHRPLPKNIGLIVIDEQHRFGVHQRMQLLEQSAIPHVLSMTATPIPRTIALTLYSELDLSVIDEMPLGRQKIKTWVVPESKRQAAYTWMKDQINTHHSQAFVVCPFVSESENPLLDEVKAIETEFHRLTKQVHPHTVAAIHGRIKPKEKARLMLAFKNKEFDILLATPVIEVGIDIQNATIMVIESAERFGLATLHQLRGRVGRGDQQSYCLLFTSNNRQVSRLKHLETTHSGFRLAELDLTLRGPGNLYGKEQSGYIDLRFANLTDSELIATTHEEAKKLLKKDPELNQNVPVKDRIKTILANQTTPH